MFTNIDRQIGYIIHVRHVCFPHGEIGEEFFFIQKKNVED